MIQISYPPSPLSEDEVAELRRLRGETLHGVVPPDDFQALS